MEMDGERNVGDWCGVGIGEIEEELVCGNYEQLCKAERGERAAMENRIEGEKNRE